MLSTVVHPRSYLPNVKTCWRSEDFFFNAATCKTVEKKECTFFTCSVKVTDFKFCLFL